MESNQNRDLGQNIVRAAWVLGLSILVSSIILGIGAIVTVTSSAERGAVAIENAAQRVTQTVDRAFGEPMRLETTLAMPQPVTVQGQGLEGAIPINTDVFTDNQDGKRGEKE